MAPNPERRLTEKLARVFAPLGPNPLELGIGDDAAVLRRPRGRPVVCCDPVVEEVHFGADAPMARVAHKAVHRNLSDLAAMGARPVWLLVSLLWPQGRSSRQRDALLRGLARTARNARCPVVGGDVGTTPGPLTVTVTAGGELDAGVKPLRRDALRVGDSLYVTGPLGGASAGHHLRFEARVEWGGWLSRQPNVSAAIDISDGLVLDLATMLRASGAVRARALGAELNASAIPIRRSARRLGGDPLRRALGDGEDYELLFAARGALAAGGPLPDVARHPIGRVCEQRGITLQTESGTERLDPGREGYGHDL